MSALTGGEYMVVLCLLSILTRERLTEPQRFDATNGSRVNLNQNLSLLQPSSATCLDSGSGNVTGSLPCFLNRQEWLGRSFH